jgi:hypothetical protein
MDLRRLGHGYGRRVVEANYDVRINTQSLDMSMGLASWR